MKKSKAVRKKADTKKITISSETYSRLFECAMKVWDIEKKELQENGVNKNGLIESGLTEKQAIKSITSNPPGPETVTTMAVTALEYKLEEVTKRGMSNKTLH